MKKVLEFPSFLDCFQKRVRPLTLKISASGRSGFPCPGPPVFGGKFRILPRFFLWILSGMPRRQPRFPGTFTSSTSSTPAQPGPRLAPSAGHPRGGTAGGAAGVPRHRHAAGGGRRGVGLRPAAGAEPAPDGLPRRLGHGGAAHRSVQRPGVALDMAVVANSRPGLIVPICLKVIFPGTTVYLCLFINFLKFRYFEI